VLTEIDGLPSEFPPLRTGDAPRLVEGRERELAQAAAAAAAAAALPSRVARRAVLVAVAAIVLAGAIVTGFVLSTGTQGAKVAANSVAAIDPSGKVTASVPVGATPIALASTNNALWVANLDDQTVTHVDPETGQAVRTISVGDSPTGIAAVNDTVWVAAGANSVDEIDPRYDQLTSRHVVKTIGTFAIGTPPRPALHAFGSLWVIHPDGYVQRFDPASLHVEATVDAGNGPSAIAAGAGSVWVTNSADGTVTRIDSTTLVTTTIPVGHGPASISVNASGAWVANAGDNDVARIDLTTNAVTGTSPVGDTPTAILATPSAVWVANRDDGTVTRLDPVSGKPTKTIQVGGAPSALIAAGNRIWVAVAAAAASAQAIGGVARLTVNGDLAPLDPALAGTGPFTIPLLYATCANLVTYPDKPAPEGSRVVPEIAEALPVPTDGGTTYTFKIRRGFRFSPPSNAPVTAAVLKATIERITNPRMKSPVAFLFANIRRVTARGDTLTIRLSHPDGGFLGNIAAAPLCALPIGTPINPRGINTVPTAGPYYVASYTPNQQLVLKRNPNYHGDRPHRLDEIVYTLGDDPSRGVAEVEASKADYVAGNLPSTAGPTLAARYGPGSPAAKAGHQQYFISPALGARWLHMNVSRPLFRHVALREAVNYALDRAAIAAEDRKFFVGNPFNVGEPTADYMPQTMTGATEFHLYPVDRPDLAKARQLAGRIHATAIMYAASNPPWPQEAQVIAQDLRPIGIDVQVKVFPTGAFFARLGQRGAPFDLAVSGWAFGTADPAQALSPQFDGRTIAAKNNNDLSYFDSPSFNAQLDAAAKLFGARRYRTYDRLAYELEHDYAPVAAIATQTSRDFFSARIGCQIYQPVFGIDLAALCIRH
jgi:peptide/nickel transport system substrate-binding protein